MSKPKWMDIAAGEIGQKEIPGPVANPRIVAYDACTSLKATSDEVPWCAAFVCWCLEQAGIGSTRSAMASSYLNWGMQCEPRPGCIVVIRHEGLDAATGSLTGNHVAFLVSIDSAHINLLGGNQHDSVKISSFPLAAYEVRAFRWPEGYDSNGDPVVDNS